MTNTSLNDDDDKNTDMNGRNRSDGDDLAEAHLSPHASAAAIDNSNDVTNEAARSAFARTGSVFKQNGRGRRGSSIF